MLQLQKKYRNLFVKIEKIEKISRNKINSLNTDFRFYVYMINNGYCFQLHVPPPNLMHEYDRMIPASKGDGPSQWILSVDKKCHHFQVVSF